MKTRKLFLIVLALLAIWISVDMLIPVKKDIRQFDPAAIAQKDTEMWRSYYDRKPMKLFFQLASLMRQQFNAPFWRSHVIAFYAAKGAFVFKKGKERADYEKALPALEKYYTFIQNMSTTDFDIKEAARLELEWWIVHRQRAQHQGGDLEKVLAESAAVMYKIDAERLMTYAKYRANAMEIRDSEQEKDGVSEAEWNQIATLLNQCWNALHLEVNKRAIH